MSSSLSLTSSSLSTIAIILHRHCHRCHHRPPPPHRRLSLIAIMWLIAAWCCLLPPPLSITAAADVIVVILLVVHSCRCHHRSPPLTPMSSSSTANLSSFVPDCHHVVDCYVARFGGGKGARCHPCHLAVAVVAIAVIVVIVIATNAHDRPRTNAHDRLCHRQNEDPKVQINLPSTLGLRGDWADNLMGICWPWFDCLCFYRGTRGIN